MQSTTSSATIGMLLSLFAAYGIPEELVSDNEPQFTSEEFFNIHKELGIKHTISAPYHPATNSAAERIVQILKQALKSVSGSNINHKLSNFLLTYRNTPHSLTGQTPAELFLKRVPHTRLSMLKPNLAKDVEGKQAQQKKFPD